MQLKRLGIEKEIVPFKGFSVQVSGAGPAAGQINGQLNHQETVLFCRSFIREFSGFET